MDSVTTSPMSLNSAAPLSSVKAKGSQESCCSAQKTMVSLAWEGWWQEDATLSLECELAALVAEAGP